VKRRFPALIVVLAAIVALVLVGRETVEPVTPTFSVTASGWMPSVPVAAGLTETWFCPGVPATGVDGVEGTVVIANRGESRMVGTVLVMNDAGESTRLDLAVDGWASSMLDLDATLPGGMVGAVIEVEGGGAVVEQHAIHPAGNSVAPCSNATSDTWYFADGFTVDGSLDQLVLTNPYDQTVVVNIEFATREGPRRPNSYRGLTVPARSIRVIDLGAPGAGAQSEPILAVAVEASRGRLVVGRSQHFLGGGRLGTQVTLASPAVRDQWWFAGGQVGDGISERYSIYNPTEDDVEVDQIFLGIEAAVQGDPIEVPAGEVRTFDPTTITVLDENGAEVQALDDGRYTVVFATLAAQSIVVERATTSTVGETVATSVIAGATPRQDGLVSTEWHIPSAPDEAVGDALMVHNADNLPGEVTVFVVGRSGPVPVPGLENVPLPAAALVTLDLTDPIVLDRELIVTSTSRVFVERSVPTGRGDTRTSAWAIPAG
jgi:hypothetical protein